MSQWWGTNNEDNLTQISAFDFIQNQDWGQMNLFSACLKDQGSWRVNNGEVQIMKITSH